MARNIIACAFLLITSILLTACPGEDPIRPIGGAGNGGSGNGGSGNGGSGNSGIQCNSSTCPGCCTPDNKCCTPDGKCCSAETQTCDNVSASQFCGIGGVQCSNCETGSCVNGLCQGSSGCVACQGCCDGNTCTDGKNILLCGEGGGACQACTGGTVCSSTGLGGKCESAAAGNGGGNTGGGNTGGGNTGGSTSCPYGNGPYCGATLNRDANKLFNCTDGVITLIEDCGSAGCYIAPPYKPDTCNTGGGTGGAGSTGTGSGCTDGCKCPLVGGKVVTGCVANDGHTCASTNDIKLTDGGYCYTCSSTGWASSDSNQACPCTHQRRLRKSCQSNNVLGKCAKTSSTSTTTSCCTKCISPTADTCDSTNTTTDSCGSSGTDCDNCQGGTCQSVYNNTSYVCSGGSTNCPTSHCYTYQGFAVDSCPWNGNNNISSVSTNTKKCGINSDVCYKCTTSSHNVGSSWREIQYDKTGCPSECDGSGGGTGVCTYQSGSYRWPGLLDKNGNCCYKCLESSTDKTCQNISTSNCGAGGDVCIDCSSKNGCYTYSSSNFYLADCKGDDFKLIVEFVEFNSTLTEKTGDGGEADLYVKGETRWGDGDTDRITDNTNKYEWNLEKGHIRDFNEAQLKNLDLKLLVRDQYCGCIWGCGGCGNDFTIADCKNIKFSQSDIDYAKSHLIDGKTKAITSGCDTWNSGIKKVQLRIVKK